MIDWDYYSKRRNVNLVNLILRNNIENYEQLVQLLEEKGVNAPPKGMFQSAYAIAVPPIPALPPETSAPENKPTTTKRKRRATRKSTAKQKG